ncbi:MAG: class I tRNA ligase family protein [Clostridiales bacterium]|nr:class I tRNA ligase family protein [Clostridiales bacterium]
MAERRLIKRPVFPERIVITAGMPNGNKPLHIGHIGAIFLWADAYARYMRDNIGSENVIFVSGTDGFGSVAEEKYRKLKEAGEYSGTLSDYIGGYHETQKKTLQKYGISLNLFAASCFGESYEHHKRMSAYFFEEMLKSGYMAKKDTEQFYDKDFDMILNGRQVEGKCPIDGCKSEVGYADECSLGHQYSPSELIDPISKLSGKKPQMKLVSNYYLRLEAFREDIKKWCDKLEAEGCSRKFMIRDMRDFLQPPMLFVSESAKDMLDAVTDKLPEHAYFHDEKNKRVQLKFTSVDARDTACTVLKDAGIRYRSNKTLAPFRISGNAKWGVPMPTVSDGSTDGLTFYVWPESLWAPVSFTDTYLESIGKRVGKGSKWQDWWCQKDAKVVQFIGEDNVFFYCLAQTGVFLAVQGKNYGLEKENGKLNLTYVVANKHLLVANAKAGSSGTVTAPTADSLLDYYTVEQLRMHFLGQGIGSASANFASKVFFPEEFAKSGDPVLLQGNILTNIFNRIVRSVFYSLQQYFDGKLPTAAVTSETLAKAADTLEKYEYYMNRYEFNNVIGVIDEYFRSANAHWAEVSKTGDNEVKARLIADTVHVIKTGVLMLHSIAPDGAELVAEYMKAGGALFDWKNADKTFCEILPEVGAFKFLEPRFDFFKKHESQL